MIEEFEFRIAEDDAHLLGSAAKGPLARATYGVVRVLTRRGTPTFDLIHRLDDVALGRGRAFVHSWRTLRRFSESEWAQAGAIYWYIERAFEPVGVDCGTRYDDKSGCPWCHRERIRLTRLQLARGSIPRGSIGAARTIAGERIVSEAFVTAWDKAELTGAVFSRIDDRRGAVIEGWQSMDVTASVRVAAPPTLFGDVPWDRIVRSPELCPLGHVGGRNLVTQLAIDGVPEHDISVTDVLVGEGGGDLVSEPLMVLSPRARRLLLEHRLRVGRLEVARVLEN